MKQKVRKILSLLLAATMVFSSITVFAEETEELNFSNGFLLGNEDLTAMTNDTLLELSAAKDVWDGSVAEGFAGGDGSKEDPYQIATGAQFAYLAQKATPKERKSNVVLTQNIDLANHQWLPCVFRGNFNGGGHTIYNLAIGTPEDLFGTMNTYGHFDGVGLFEQFSGEIMENVNLENVNIYVYQNNQAGHFGALVGSLIGNAYRDYDEDNPTTMKIINCSAIGVNIVSMQGNSRFGGLIGSLESYNNVAAGDYAEVINCFAKGQISAIGRRNYNIYMGGLCGDVSSPFHIENCYSDVTLSFTENEGNTNQQGSRYFGSFIGRLGFTIQAGVNNFYNDGEINNCYVRRRNNDIIGEIRDEGTGEIINISEFSTTEMKTELVDVLNDYVDSYEGEFKLEKWRYKKNRNDGYPIFNEQEPEEGGEEEPEEFIAVKNISDVPTATVVGKNLTLSGTVTPEDADNKTIVWSVKDQGSTGATISGNTFSAAKSGTAVVTATIKNGKSKEEDYTQDFEITVDIIPVENISNVPTTTVEGKNLTLTGKVSPTDATNKDIVWSVKKKGNTGATISGNVLSTTAPGTAVVTATVVKGKSEKRDYTQDFTITVEKDFVPVTNISNVRTSVTIDTATTLVGRVVPSDATNKDIVWTIKDPGTTGAIFIKDKVVSADAVGDFVLTATIPNGKAENQDYKQDFTISAIKQFIGVTNIAEIPTEATVESGVELTGNIVPSDATNQGIIWKVKDAGETGATISDNTLSVTGKGEVIVTATIPNGSTVNSDYIKDVTIVVTKEFEEVTDITDVPTEAMAGEDLTLTGTVVPYYATNQEIAWSIKDAGTTEATISENILSATEAGIVIVTATIDNGESILSDYIKDFIITVENPFVEVEDIVDVTEKVIIGEDLALTGTVVPSKATNKEIVWSIKDQGTAGATILDNVLSVLAEGSFVVTATIIDGESEGNDYTQDFTIIAKEAFTAVTEIKGVPVETIAGEDLTLTSTVVPSKATNKDVVWSVKDAGTTGATISDNVLTAAKDGQVVITATIINGKTEDSDYTQDFTIKVEKGFVAVTDITDVPMSTLLNVPLTLTGIVEPVASTNQTIVWSVKDAGTTGATVSDNILSTAAKGEVVITATIADGLDVGSDYTKDFTVTVTDVYIAVADITDVPKTAVADKPLTLDRKILPENATYQTVVWSLKDAGDTEAIVEGKVFTAKSAGTAVVTATIVNGTDIGSDYTKDFTITVEPKEEPDSDFYTISVSATPFNGGEVSESENVKVNSIVTVTAAANDNYRFDGWLEDEDIVNTDKEYTFTVTADRLLTAKFTYTGGNGGNSGGNGGGNGGSGGSGSGSSGGSGSGSSGGGSSSSKASKNSRNSLKDDVSLEKGEKETNQGVEKNDGKDTVKDSRFTDVDSSKWYYDAVNYVVSNNIMQGMNDTIFGGEINLNRAMIVQMLYNIDGKPSTESSKFDDVKNDDWYADAIAWAADNGIVNGIGNNLFAPEQDITREQMTVILYNYCLYKGIELPVVRETDSFADGYSINSWAAEAVNAMYRAGVLSGKGNNIFQPQGKATRAEVAQIVYGLYGSN